MLESQPLTFCLPIFSLPFIAVALSFSEMVLQPGTVIESLALGHSGKDALY